MSAESGSESIDIEATPEAIFQVMTDIDSFPKWMDEFKEATVVDRDDQGRPTRASFELDAKIKTVRYVLGYSYPEGGLAWESEPGGDVKLIKGSYLLSPPPREPMRPRSPTTSRSIPASPSPRSSAARR